MEFFTLIRQLSDSLKQPLPGEWAQNKMAPMEMQLRAEALLSNPNPKPSAVLVLFYPVNEEPHFVLIQRVAYEGVHSRQISFPGGKQDPQDESLKVTALREAHEEIGIPPHQVNLIGPLTNLFIPPSGFLVEPYVAFANERPDFQHDEKEVKYIIEVPINLLLDETIVKEKMIHIATRNVKIQAPYFDIQGHVVWGATAMMLSELKEILRNTAT